MRVSIILPSYNHENLIEYALASCYEQSYNDIELVVSDDNSSDKTRFVIDKILAQKKYKSRFSRIQKIYNSMNLGAYKNIYLASLKCNGHLISILNTDDYFDHSRIEKIVEKVGKSKSSWGFTGVNPIDMNGKIIEKANLPPVIKDVFEYYDLNIDKYGLIENMLFSRNIAISSGNLFFTPNYKKLLKYFEDFKYCGDWGFVLCAAYLQSPIYINEKLLHYRIHNNNSFSGLKQEGEHECDQLSILAECLYLTGWPKNTILKQSQNLNRLRNFYSNSRPALNSTDRQTVRGPQGVNILTNFRYVDFAMKIKNII